MSPRTPVLSRISDPRVIQYWDKHHLVAQSLRLQTSRFQLQPDCCDHKGFYWDMAALYPKQGQWEQVRPVFVNGAVAPVSSKLQAALVDLLKLQ
jgi:hypothetical protein